jgi:hypothetical protein
VDVLHGLMVARADDPAFVAATTAAAARLLDKEPSRTALLAQPELAARLAELLQSPAREVGGRLW